MTPSTYTEKKLVVVGGGAAGFFCAVNAARLCPGLHLTIIEKSAKLLSKVTISGGGRCNVTHACFNITDMIKQYPRGAQFLKSAFTQFFTKDTIQWFTSRGVPLKTESDGRMFPESNSSASIVNCLLQEANQYHINIMLQTGVQEILQRFNEPVAEMVATQKTAFTLHCSNGKTLEADYVCIACGGYPKSSQFDWLLTTGHHIDAPVPSLFTCNIPNNAITALMGVSVSNCLVKIAGTKLQQQGPMLITHWGLSGPAILKLSAWGARDLFDKNYEYDLIVNWLPDYHETSLKEKFQQIRFERAAQKIINRNPFLLPARLWEYFLQQCGVAEDMRWADLPAKEQNKLVKILCGQTLPVKGKTTFKEEFVTSGGIHLPEVQVQSMESKLVPGLFFAGEILNVDGVTGGFNFQNAWTTGWIAAHGIAAKAQTSG